MRRWSVVAALAACVMGLGTGRAGAEAKRLLGTVRVTGPVEAALPGEAMRPFTGGAAVDGMQIKTGAGGVAVVQLSDGDVLGLAESSTLELSNGNSGRVRLLDGRLALRLRSESALEIDAAAATVRPPAVSPVAVGQREALVSVTEGTALVRPYRGAFEMAGPDEGTITQVQAGQQATLAPQAEAPVVVAAAAGTSSLKADASTAAKAGGGGLLATLGLSPTMATILGTGAAAVVGVGGAAAAGAFSSDGDGSDGGGGAQGSPFRP